MALDPKVQAATALHRFGFAPKSGGLAAFMSDPRGVLIAEIEKAHPGQIANDDLLSTGEAARAAFDFRQERKATRLAERAQREADKTAGEKSPANEQLEGQSGTNGPAGSGSECHEG